MSPRQHRLEFFCELTRALSTWRPTGATVKLVPSGARISFRPPRLRIEIGTRPRATSLHAQSERFFIGGKFQRELLVVASRECCRRARSYVLHAIGDSQITRLAGGHCPLSRPQLWSWNLDRFARCWRWSRSRLWHCWVWDCFRNIKGLRARLMCAHHAGSPA